MSFENMVADLAQAEKASQKFEGVFTKMSKGINKFMTAKGETNPVLAFSRRIAYSFKGTFTVINKNGLLGKGLGKLSKIKMPNFSENLGVAARAAVTKAQETVAQLQSGGISGMMNKGMDIRATLSNRRAAVKARRSKKVSKEMVGAKTIAGHKGGEGGFASLFEGLDKQTKGISQRLKEGSMKWLTKSKNLVLGVLKLSRTILSKAFNFFIITILVITAIALALKLVWEGLQSFFTGFVKPFEGFFASIEKALHTIWDSFSTIIDFFMGDASFMEMAFAVLDIMVATAYVIIKFAITVLHAILSGLGQMIYDAGMAALDWFKGLNGKQWLMVAGAALIAMVLWMYSLPIIFPLIIVGGVMIVAKWLWSKLSDWDVFADGGTSSGGMAIVGERGPELVNLPAGSRVHSNKASGKMVAGGSGTTIINNITINARDTSDTELRRIADKIGSMVNSKINRSTSSRTMG